MHRHSLLARPPNWLRWCGPLAALGVTVLLGSVVGLAACSGAAGGPHRLTVVGRDTMQFEPASLAATAGQPVELTLRNAGSMAHDFVLADGVDVPIMLEAEPGTSATTRFTLDR